MLIGRLYAEGKADILLIVELPAGLLGQAFKVIPLEETPPFAENLLAGRVNGQVVAELTL